LSHHPPLHVEEPLERCFWIKSSKQAARSEFGAMWEFNRWLMIVSDPPPRFKLCQVGEGQNCRHRVSKSQSLVGWDADGTQRWIEPGRLQEAIASVLCSWRRKCVAKRVLVALILLYQSECLPKSWRACSVLVKSLHQKKGGNYLCYCRGVTGWSDLYFASRDRQYVMSYEADVGISENPTLFLLLLLMEKLCLSLPVTKQPPSQRNINLFKLQMNVALVELFVRRESHCPRSTNATGDNILHMLAKNWDQGNMADVVLGLVNTVRGLFCSIRVSGSVLKAGIVQHSRSRKMLWRLFFEKQSKFFLVYGSVLSLSLTPSPHTLCRRRKWSRNLPRDATSTASLPCCCLPRPLLT